MQDALDCHEKENLAPTCTDSNICSEPATVLPDNNSNMLTDSLKTTTSNDKQVQICIPPVTRTRRIQVGRTRIHVDTVSIGIQCNMETRQNCICNHGNCSTTVENEECDIGDGDGGDIEMENSFDTCTSHDPYDDITMDPDFDPDLVTPSDNGDDDDGNDDDELVNYRMEVTENPTDEKYYIVSESALCELLSQCKTCNEACIPCIDYSKGTMISVVSMCANQHMSRWNSQSVHRKLPWFNLLLSSSILTSGCNVAPVLRCLEQARVKSLSPRSVSRLQALYTVPAVIAEFKEQQSDVLNELRGRFFFLYVLFFKLYTCTVHSCM